MGETTKIQWTDHTFNPWIGCARVAPGCVNCYAEADMDRRRGRVVWGPHGTRSRTSDDYWQQPAKWNKQAEAAGVRQRVFCASLADVFEDWTGAITNQFGDSYHHGAAWNRKEKYIAIPDVHIGKSLVSMTDLRRDLFDLIDATPWLDWLLLTKRPENIIKMWPSRADFVYIPEAGSLNELSEFHRSNVWLGTSVSEQQTADDNVPKLLECARLADVLFVSAEPLLGPIDFRCLQHQGLFELNSLTGANGLTRPLQGIGPRINWIIVGGESGPGARPCEVEWIRQAIQQCHSADVPCFVKQLGAWPLHNGDSGDGRAIRTITHAKGGDPTEWPADLRVRQFPEVRRA